MTTPVHSFAAILFSDIEGYTTMIQQNEAEAISMVNRYQEVLEQVVPKFNGEVKQHYGDGSLTVFDTAENAVNCAQYLQKELMSSIPLRMGIHCGDVVLHDEKMFGDTVNIASRVESLGQPGAVLFSDEVMKHLQGTDFDAISMGHFKFKNVERKMEVFALVSEGLHIPKVGSLSGKLEPERSFKLPFLIIGLFGFIMLGLWLGQVFENAPEPNDSIPQLGSPSIAVLPFVNLSPDSSQEYFADGLAQEVLVLLTQDPKLKVTSQSSSFTFKDQVQDIPDIARQLQVRYVLEGQVQKSGDSLQIEVQLINAEMDTPLWEQSWQREVRDVFSIQQEIADSVKMAMNLELKTDRQMPQQTSPEAYTLYLQAFHVSQQGNVEGLKNAKNLLIRSLEIDSTYAPAWAALANILHRQSNIGFLPMAEGQEQARQAATSAISINSTISSPWATLGSISIYYDRNFKKAEYYINKAREAEPGGWNILKLASNLYFCLGDVEQAIELDRRSIELDPINAKSYFDLGYGYFVSGEYERAEATARQGMLMNPGHLGGPYLLSLVLMEQGKLDEAQQVAHSEPYHILKVHALSLIAFSMNLPDTANNYLNEIKEKYPTVAPYQIAQVYSHQNEPDSAFKWLQLAYEFGDGGLLHMKSDPFLKYLATDPRWNQLISKMAFP